MKKACTFVAVALFALLVVSDRPANARAQYSKAFREKYSDLEAKSEEVKHCGVCHGGENGAKKKVLSDYGKALKEALEKPNVKDEEQIAKAFEKVAKKDVSEGKTFGDLLKSGKLPPAAKDE